MYEIFLFILCFEVDLSKVILGCRDIILGGYILIKNAFICPKKGSSLGAILLHKTSQSPIGLLGPYNDICGY